MRSGRAAATRRVSALVLSAELCRHVRVSSARRATRHVSDLVILVIAYRKCVHGVVARVKSCSTFCSSSRAAARAEARSAAWRCARLSPHSPRSRGEIADMCASCVREKVLFQTRVCRAGWRRGHTRNSHVLYTAGAWGHTYDTIGLMEAQKSDEGQTFRRRPGSGSMIPTRWAVGRLSHEQKHAHADICSRKKDDSAAAAAGQGPQIKTVRQSCIEDVATLMHSRKASLDGRERDGRKAPCIHGHVAKLRQGDAP